MQTETELIPVSCRDCGEDGFLKPWDGKLFGMEVEWVYPEAEQEMRESKVRGYKCKPCTMAMF